MATAPYRTLTAVGSTVALVLTLLVAPGTGPAAGAFQSLRAPGEAGFIAAHRGGAEAPENTLEAMRLAIDGPAAFVETDVQLTSDGVPVLMHDWTIDRTTDGTGPLWAHTWQEVQRLDAGSWFGPEFAGARVPSLEQFLAVLAPSGKQALLELKGSWTRAQVRTVLDLLADAGVEHRVVLASFSLTTLQYLRDAADHIPRAIISRKVSGDPAVLAAACGAIAIITSRAFLVGDPGAVDRIHAAGLGVLAYTLNNEDSWTVALSLGVDGFITDQSAGLRTWLSTFVEPATP